MLTEDEVSVAAGLMSADRLASFLQLTGTDRDALSIHEETIATSAAIMPVLCIIEVALRNAICERLRNTLNKPDWLTSPPRSLTWRDSEKSKIKDAERQARRAIYAKLSSAGKRALDAVAYPTGIPANTAKKTRTKARQATLTITTGQLIAQFTFFFWKRLFSAHYEETLWKRSLRKLFPNKDVQRASVALHLERIYECRNRLAHHEPIIGKRLDSLLESIEFICTHFHATEPGEDAILYKMTAASRKYLSLRASRLGRRVTTFEIS